jgi:hypothetical protein
LRYKRRVMNASPRTSLPEQVLSHFREGFDSGTALAALDEACQGECYIVGGAIRDVALGTPRSGDLDVMVPNGDRRAFAMLDGVGVPFVHNSHGNRRYRWNRLQLDVFEPMQFYTGFRTVEAALGFFDLRINALALHLGSARLLDPIGGMECIARRTVGINWARWNAMPSAELAILLIRLARILADEKTLSVPAEDAASLLERVVPSVADLDWQPFRDRFPLGREVFFDRLDRLLRERAARPNLRSLSSAG